MISKVECSILECDNCKEPYENHSGFSIFNDKLSMMDDAQDDEWHTGDGTEGIKDAHYCPKCWSRDSEDFFHINESRTIKEDTK